MKAKKGNLGRLVLEVSPFELISEADRHFGEIKLLEVTRKDGTQELWLSCVVNRRLSLSSGLDKIQTLEFVAKVERF